MIVAATSQGFSAVRCKYQHHLMSLVELLPQALFIAREEIGDSPEPPASDDAPCGARPSLLEQHPAALLGLGNGAVRVKELVRRRRLLIPSSADAPIS